MCFVCDHPGLDDWMLCGFNLLRPASPFEASRCYGCKQDLPTLSQVPLQTEQQDRI